MNGLKMLDAFARQRKRERFPNLPEFALSIRKYQDKTANDLTRCIIDWVTLNGGYAVRINTTGIYREDLGKYVPGGTKKGTADIHICENGLHLSVEVKIGADKLSLEQIECKKEVERAGGRYFVAKDFQSFFEFYQRLMAQKEKLLHG